MYRQLITEASARELAAKYYPSYDDNFILWIMKQDPSIPAYTASMDKPFGTYTKQLLAWATNQSLPTSEYRVRNTMTEYDELRKYMPPEYSNINKFRTFQDLEAYLISNRIELKAGKAAKESSIFYEDSEWVVRIPKTYFASNFYAHDPEYNGGYEADWCTSYSANHWNHYQDGTLYMVMHKVRPESSMQLFMADERHELRDYADDEGWAGHLPVGFKDLIDNKYSVELNELFPGDDGDDEGTDEVYFSLRADIKNGEVVGSMEADLRTYFDGGDTEHGIPIPLHFTIRKFSLSDLSPADMVSSPDVNFSAPGLLVSLPDGGMESLAESARNEWWGVDHYTEGIDTTELMDSLLTMVTGETDVIKYRNDLRTKDIDKGPVGLPVGFVVFEAPGDPVGPRDGLVTRIAHAVSLFYPYGIDLKLSHNQPWGHVVMYSTAYGGLKDALQDPTFAAYVQGEIPAEA